MWGSPGTMIAAQVLYERTGADAVARGVAPTLRTLLWAEWHDDLWVQDLYGSRVRYLGPAHGFAGNVFALARGDGLDAARRAELERRAIATAARYAQHADGSASGRRAPIATRSGKPQPIRTQWCHGAPGIVASLASLAPDDEQLTELLAGRRRADLAGRPAREGSQPLPRHRRQRLRLSEAVRAHGRRALARTRARIRHARGRADRAGAEPSTGAAATRSGRAIPARPSTCTTASPPRRASRPSTTSSAGRGRPRRGR